MWLCGVLTFNGRGAQMALSYLSAFCRLRFGSSIRVVHLEGLLHAQLLGGLWGESWSHTFDSLRGRAARRHRDPRPGDPRQLLCVREAV